MSDVGFDKSFQSPRRGLVGSAPRPRSNFFPSGDHDKQYGRMGSEEEYIWLEGIEEWRHGLAAGFDEPVFESRSNGSMPTRRQESSSSIPVSRFSKVFGEGDSRLSNTAPVSARGTPVHRMQQYDQEKGRIDFGEDLSEKLNKVLISSTPNSPLFVSTNGWNSVTPMPLGSNSRGKSSIWNDSDTKKPLRCSSRNSEHSFQFEPFVVETPGESFDILTSKPLGRSGTKSTELDFLLPPNQDLLGSSNTATTNNEELKQRQERSKVQDTEDSQSRNQRDQEKPGSSSKDIRIKLPRSTSVQSRPGLFEEKARQNTNYGQEYSTTFYRRNSHGYMFIKEPATTLRVSSVGSKSWVYIKVQLAQSPTTADPHKVKVYTSEIPVWHPMSSSSASKHNSRPREQRRRNPSPRDSTTPKHFS